MAKLYGKNPAVDFAGANLMSFGKSFSRLNGQPLDKSEVWYNLAELEAYALTDAAYVGQKVIYVAMNADGVTGTVTHYSIEVDGSLRRIDSQDVTISVSDDDVVNLEANGATITASHAKKGPEGGAAKGATADASISAFGSSIEFKVPKVTVDEYGHTTALDEKTVSIALPNAPEDKDTKTKVVSGDDLIVVTPDELVENSLNIYTVKIDDAKLKALIGSETTAAMEFKGAIAELPVSANKGDVYKASAAFIVDSTEDAEGKGYTTEIGDSIVADENGKWYLIPSGDDIEDTWRPVTDVDNTSTLTFAAGAKLDVEVKADGTITYSHEKVDAPVLVEGGSGRTYITELISDEYGHITGYKVATESDQEIPEYVDANTHYELSVENDDTVDSTVNLVLSNDDNDTRNLVPITGAELIDVKYDDESKQIIIATPSLSDGLIVNDETNKIVLDLGTGLGIDSEKKISVLVPVDGHIVVNSNNELTLGALPVYETITNDENEEEKVLKTPGTGIFKVVYTKDETNDAIADAVKVATGGESASDVRLELNNYKKKVNSEVWGDESGTGVTVGDQTNLSRIDILQANVGDLSKLIRDEGRENTTLVDEINYINERLTWGEMAE